MRSTKAWQDSVRVREHVKYTVFGLVSNLLIGDLVEGWPCLVTELTRCSIWPFNAVISA